MTRGENGSILDDDLRRARVEQGLARWRSRFADILEQVPGHRAAFRRDEDDVVTLLMSRVEKYPNRSCLIDAATGERFTYADVGARILRIGEVIERTQPPRAHVLVLGTSSVEMALALLGTIAGGCVPAMASDRVSAPELTRLCQQIRPSLVLSESPADLPSESDLVGASTLSIGELLESASSSSRWRPRTAPPSGEDWALLLPTGGSTGLPKIVVLSHRNVTQNLSFFRYGLRLDETAVSLVATPLFHVTGLMAQLLHMLEVGGASVLLRRFTAAAFVAAAERYKVTFSCLVPTMIRLITIELESTGSTLHSFETLLYGGAAMDPMTVARVAACLPRADLVNTYGSTETSGSVTFMPPELRTDHPLAVGLPSPITSIAFDPAPDDVGDNRLTFPLDESGMVTVCGGSTSPVYLAWNGDRPVVALGSESNGVESDGCWRSSDIGGSRDGLLYVFGRADDVINRAGEKIHPGEVEHILLRHWSVAEAVVWGEPDEILGSSVVAAVVLRPGAVSDEAELTAFLRKHLSGHKVPRRIYCLPDLPKTAVGKIDKETLSRTCLLAQNASGKVRPSEGGTTNEHGSE